jgi:hypothetical protein
MTNMGDLLRGAGGDDFMAIVDANFRDTLMTNMGDLLRSVVGDDLMAILDANFRDMEDAEAVIQWGKEKYPDDADKIDRLFRFCRRTYELIPATVSGDVYRMHLRELVDMVVHDQPIDLPTRVEMACALLQVSLEVPLADEYNQWLLRHSPLTTVDTRAGIKPLAFGQIRKIERKLVEHLEEFTAWRHEYYPEGEDQS